MNMKSWTYDSPIDFSYVLEPCARNTAPAIAMAAMSLSEHEDGIMLVLPADHMIENQQGFAAAVDSAVSLAQQDYLVTFGIQPDKPETGYGYIQKGIPVDSDKSTFHVENFVEKPDQITAEKYLQSGQYLWNSGMFCFKPSVYLEALKKLSPEYLRSGGQVLECFQAERSTSGS